MRGFRIKVVVESTGEFCYHLIFHFVAVIIFMLKGQDNNNVCHHVFAA